MGLPFDWHLRPRRITQLRSSASRQMPEAGAPLGLGRLSSLRQSVAGIRNSLRRFSMHPVRSSLQAYADVPEHTSREGAATSHMTLRQF